MILQSRRAVLGHMSAAGLLAMGGCGQKAGTNPVVHIATAAGSFNMTMSTLLRQQKFLEALNVEPDMIAIADGSKIMASVISGSIDIAPLSGFGQVFPAIERGADIKLISASTLTPMLALYSGKADVKGLKDLEGKVVGVGALGSLVHQLTATLMHKHGVDVSKVKFINLGSNTDVFKGVMAGTVSAGCGPASFIPDAETYKVHLVENGDMSVELSNYTYQGGWTSQKMIDTKRDALVRVLAAYAKLFRFVENPSSREAFLTARRTAFPSSPEMEHVGEWNFLQRAKPLALDLILSEERVRYMQQVNLDFEVQKEMLPYAKVADMSLAQEALKLAETT